MKLKYLGIACACALAGLAAAISSPVKVAKADDPVETNYSDLYMNELQLKAKSGSCTTDSNNNLVTVMPSGNSFVYTGPNNLSTSFTMVVENSCSWAAWTYINVRATFAEGKTLPTESNAFSNSGYQISWRANGSINFKKNGTLIGSPSVSGLKYQEGNARFETIIQTIDMSDGSVRFRFYVNSNLIFEYNDAEDPITGDQLTFKSDSVRVGFECPDFDKPNSYSLEDAGSPSWNSNFPISSYSNGVVTTSAGGTSGYSGVVYATQNYGSYGYKANIKFLQQSGAVYLSIGGTNGGGQYNIPTVIGDSGWSDTGYVINLDQWGPLKLQRNGVTLASFSGKAFVTDATWEIEYSLKFLEDGSCKIILFIDGSLYINYFDIKTNENTPLTPKSIGGTPGSLTSYHGIWSYYVAIQISSADNASYSEKTLLKSALGNPVFTGNQEIDLNGNVTSLDSGFISYPTLLNNTLYSFKMNLSSKSRNVFDLLVNYDGVPGGMDSASWTTKGYALKIYEEGQYYFAKGNTSVCEGWGFGGFSISTDTDYTIKFGSYQLADGVVKVVCSINSTVILNFIDTNAPITTAGKFTIAANSGAAGTISLVDVIYPVMNVQSRALVNDVVELAYDDPQVGDVVEYFIDDDASTATGTIVDDELTITSSGDLHVYCMVNGVLSESVIIECETSQYIFEARDYSTQFLSEMTCDGNGSITNNAWSSLGEDFAGLSENARNYLTNLDASAEGKDEVKAVYRYNFIINKYGKNTFNDFMGRIESHKLVYTYGANLMPLSNVAENNFAMILIVISSISAIALAAFCIYRRKKNK